ncbi:MAG: winged helix-turn-helix transcriptional regulator [Planctomycetes bacterium]|nr:winged helix-turn-helix transcriptional regulator [Planctomycetota bacterium]
MTDSVLARVLRTLERERRQRIVIALGEGPTTVSELARRVCAAKTTIRDNVRALADAGLVARVDGTSAYGLCAHVVVSNRDACDVIEVRAPGGAAMTLRRPSAVYSA